MKQIKDVTIIIPIRQELEHLKACVESIRNKKQYDTVKILIGADSPTDEIKDWLFNNQKGKFDFTTYDPKKGKERRGLVDIVPDLIKQVKTKYVYYVHADMIIGNYTLEKLLDNYEEKTVLSSVRIEPPIYPESPEKVLIDLGTEPSSFNNEFFLEEEAVMIEEHKDKIVEGFFAPHFFKKEDWVGYDPVFWPQSKEDSDLAHRFMNEGFKLLTVWSSVVYHFSGKGSRRKDGNTDSEEWKKSNFKNAKNYLRKYKTLAHTKNILPLKEPDIPISAHVLACDRDAEYVMKFLDTIEPFFEEIIFVIDNKTKSPVADEIKNYCELQKQLSPNNFDENKIKVFYRELNNDFASQTNYAISKCSNEWTMKLDLDEVFPQVMLSHLRTLINGLDDNVSVVGFPRINTLDGKVSNDIPREHWFTDDFFKYPDQPETVNNPDVQFRLHKRFETWVGEVHEVPRSVAIKDSERVNICQKLQFHHPKSRERQAKQEEQYSIISNKPKKNITKFLYDSVLYTVEGISHHAREEIKELLKRDNHVFVLDPNYRSDFGEEFLDCYKPIDVYRDEYVTIVNQAPPRWGKTEGYKNRIGYLAFEGILPDKWVEIINNSDVKELWTPSSWCKEKFLESGVTKPVAVIPHGINPDVWKEKEVTDQDITDIKEDSFMFLSIGADNCGRKGFEILAKAFSEEFKPEENVKLLFKVNMIYERGKSFQDKVRRHINPEGNTNIEYLDMDLDEAGMVDLVNTADVFVSATQAEGFGLNILESMAVGKPVIVTGASGQMDFCQEPSVSLIGVEKEIYAPFKPPYQHSKWYKPDIKHLRKLLRDAYENHEEQKKLAKKVSKKVREEHTWSMVVDKMEERIKELF